jgi:hypothetical protein
MPSMAKPNENTKTSDAIPIELIAQEVLHLEGIVSSGPIP